MPFKVGDPKRGGRQKGTPNKKTSQVIPFFEQLQKNNFDPVAEMMKLYPQLEPDSQAAMLMRMMDFIYPKKRAVETTDKPSKETLAQMVREYLDGEA